MEIDHANKVTDQQKWDRKLEFVYLYYCTAGKSFHAAYNYFRVNFFANFSTDSKSASNSAFCDTQIEYLHTNFFSSSDFSTVCKL